MSPEEKVACARIIISLILADAEINDKERTFLDEAFAAFSLTPEQQRQAYTGLHVGEIPKDAIAVLVSNEAKRTALEWANAALIIDEEIAGSEKQMLAEITKLLDLSEDEANEATRKTPSLR
jgi:Zn-finger domain-containing protein